MTTALVVKTLVALLLTITLTGCLQAPPPPPRYQMHVIGETTNALVYRLDTITGEIQTYLVMSPKFIDRVRPDVGKFIKDYYDTMEFVPGPESGTEVQVKPTASRRALCKNAYTRSGSAVAPSTHP